MMKNNKKLQPIHLSAVQVIVLFYLSATIISTILLSLPIALKPNVELSFLDALFTAVSAISVTGLGVVSTVETFSVPGLFILMLVLQFGGIGIMTLGTLIWMVLGKKIGLKERQLIMTDQNQIAFSGLVRLMRQILVIILTIELFGTIILGVYFLNYFPTWQEAFLQGLFASVSATTNAGFDITGNSLVPFAHDYFVQFINIILLILGAIGFPVLIEIREYLKHKEEYPFHFSLYTKLTTTTFFALVGIGTIAIYLFELNHYYTDKSWHEALFYSLFQSVSSRNGGLATMDMNDYSNPTLLILSGLMFIGASPSSVGGGIRTTTFAIAILSIFFFARGKSTIKIFRREVDEQDIHKSFVVISTAFLICFTAVILMSYLEPSFSLIQIIFEVSSAFGTTGLSMGITAQLSTGGKLVIIALMFIGRIGILSFLFMIRRNAVDEHYHYPKEKVMVG